MGSREMKPRECSRLLARSQLCALRDHDRRWTSMMTKRNEREIRRRKRWRERSPRELKPIDLQRSDGGRTISRRNSSGFRIVRATRDTDSILIMIFFNDAEYISRIYLEMYLGKVCNLLHKAHVAHKQRREEPRRAVRRVRKMKMTTMTTWTIMSGGSRDDVH